MLLHVHTHTHTHTHSTVVALIKTCCCDSGSFAVARGVVKVIFICISTALSKWSTCGTRAGVYLAWNGIETRLEWNTDQYRLKGIEYRQDRNAIQTK